MNTPSYFINILSHQRWERKDYLFVVMAAFPAGTTSFRSPCRRRRWQLMLLLCLHNHAGLCQASLDASGPSVGIRQAYSVCLSARILC